MELVLAGRPVGVVPGGSENHRRGYHFMIRRLLFILFLYILLVWLIVFYFYHSDTSEMLDKGLIWTAGGVAALLVWLVVEWVLGWWRVRRAQRPATPVARTAAPAPTHEDDTALLNLLR